MGTPSWCLPKNLWCTLLGVLRGPPGPLLTTDYIMSSEDGPALSGFFFLISHLSLRKVRKILPISCHHVIIWETQFISKAIHCFFHLHRGKT